MKNKNQKDRSKRSVMISLGIGAAALILFLLLIKAGASSILSFALSLCFMLGASFAHTLILRRETQNADEKLSGNLGQVMLETVVKMQNPMIICDMSGKIIWRNRAFASATTQIGSVMGSNIGTISTLHVEDLETNEEISAEICEIRYTVDHFPFNMGQKNYIFLVFTDCSEIDMLTTKVESERSVVAYILVDNLDELSQHGKNDYRSEANDVSAILRDFADSLCGILREYDRNKYMLLTNRDGLVKCRNANFDILDKIRDIRVSELSLPITISVGITDIGETLADREAGAREALSMALARGGDQVAYKGEDSMEFYGGNTRPVQKRSSVVAKVRSGEMITRISRASNVIIMGHKGADQDCFGASCGVARLAMYCYIQPYIVVDKNDKNTVAFLKKFENIPEYENVFVDENEAQSLIESDTLLVVVDVNNIDHMLSSSIALAVEDGIIIDHHRKTASKVKRDWLAEYIEPSASSASELISEMLEQSIGGEQLLREEAEALLGGIMLDTKNFTKSTGTRTFNAAIYLRSAGASVYESVNNLKGDFAEFQKQSKIFSSLTVYEGRFAIAKDESEGVPTDRIAAAKAAEALLNIKDIDAAFTLIRIGDEIHISARSNGRVSVQLILEKMGGGGHLDSAGAKSAEPMHTVLTTLKAAIDEYIEENHRNND